MDDVQHTFFLFLLYKLQVMKMFYPAPKIMMLYLQVQYWIQTLYVNV